VLQINFMLMLGCIAMVAGFQDTTALGHAYGVAVMSVMFLTTILAGNHFAASIAVVAQTQLQNSLFATATSTPTPWHMRSFARLLTSRLSFVRSLCCFVSLCLAGIVMLVCYGINPLLVVAFVGFFGECGGPTTLRLSLGLLQALTACVTCCKNVFKDVF
jgi:K+ transporter